MTVWVQTGAVEPIQTYIVDVVGTPITGLTDLYVRLRRLNGHFLDWSDMTFKAAGWTTLDKLLTEQDAVNAPGLYEVTGGLDTSALTNAVDDDVYTVITRQTPGTNAIVPAPEELRVGRWADDIADIKVRIG
jgi:hypothetical protein